MASIHPYLWYNKEAEQARNSTQASFLTHTSIASAHSRLTRRPARRDRSKLLNSPLWVSLSWP